MMRTSKGFEPFALQQKIGSARIGAKSSAGGADIPLYKKYAILVVWFTFSVW